MTLEMLFNEAPDIGVILRRLIGLDLVLEEPGMDTLAKCLGLLPDGIYANTCLKEQFHSLLGKED